LKVMRASKGTVLLLMMVAVTLMLASGVAWAATKYGTRDNDRIAGTNEYDRIFGLGGNDKLYGYGNADELYGGPGDDTIFGGRSTESLSYSGDLLCGGRGNDKLIGGSGREHYQFGPGWGTDVIPTEASDSLGDGVNFQGCQLDEPSSEWVTADLTVDLSAGEVTDGTSTVHWTPGDIEYATGGWGDDTIKGNSERNNLSGDDGNDTIDSVDGKADYVHCGDGYDSAIVDAPEDTFIFCEDVTKRR
jgi:Ca2+-binding RTX toxin-like protein